jgi:AcrR family transcriptional regulator
MMEHMSESDGAQPKPKPKRPTDERIQRTHQRLGMAMVQLIQEKPMDEVTVQQVLDRAGVGRSTFYAHFRDKDDLLYSQLEQFLEIMSSLLSTRKEQSTRVAPVAEMFAHIAEQKRLWRALQESGRMNDFLDLAQGYFTRGIELRMRETGLAPKDREAELRMRAVAAAGSLISLLRWWLDRGAREPATEMDAMFHAMVWNGLR